MGNTPTLFRIFILAILIQFCTIDDKAIMAQGKPSDNMSDPVKTTYRIEGRIVEEAAFKAFTATLEKIEGTYHCAKTIGGGRNSYEATDQNGIRWVVRSVLDGKKSRESVEKR